MSGSKLPRKGNTAAPGNETPQNRGSQPEVNVPLMVHWPI